MRTILEIEGGYVNKNLLVPIIAVAVIVLAAGGYLLTKDSGDAPEDSQVASQASDNNQDTSAKDTESSSQNDTQEPSDTSANSSTLAAESTITYSDSGFSPSSLSVKSGTTVTIRNTSGSSIQFDSDPHPAHTANPELNVGVVVAGESKTFTVTTKGSHAYHDHFDSSQTGTIVVN